MIFSCRKPDRIPRQNQARQRACSDGRWKAAVDSGRNEVRIRTRAVARTHFPSPPYGQYTSRCTTARAQKGITGRPRRVAGHTPHSSELRHCTAYPAEPEATWTQPLTREELWPISAQRPHPARCSPVHAGTETQCPSNASSEFPHVGLITENWKSRRDALDDLRRTSTIAATVRTSRRSSITPPPMNSSCNETTPANADSAPRVRYATGAELQKRAHAA
jgi:hypothetical protein